MSALRLFNENLMIKKRRKRVIVQSKKIDIGTPMHLLSIMESHQACVAFHNLEDMSFLTFIIIILFFLSLHHPSIDKESKNQGPKLQCFYMLLLLTLQWLSMISSFPFYSGVVTKLASND